MNPDGQKIEVIYLKHMELDPLNLKCTPRTLIRIKIAHNNSGSFEGKDRKFLFLLEQTDQQSPSLGEGQEYLFEKALQQSGTYSLICLNYTKIKCTIEVQQEKSLKQNQIIEQIRPSSPLCDLTQVAQQKDEEIKENNEMGYEEDKNNSKSDFADYQRILSDEDIQYDYMPNKYLKYFKEEFKLWRDFFDVPNDSVKQSSLKKQSLLKEGASSGTFSLSERQSQKEVSVSSQLHSQQQMSQVRQEEINRNKNMKKTNSEYRFNVDREINKNHPSDSKRKQVNTNTSSPNPRTQQSDVDSFVDWAWSWAQQQKLCEVKIQKLNDCHLVKQWLTFMQNKFKINEVMYG